MRTYLGLETGRRVCYSPLLNYARFLCSGVGIRLFTRSNPSWQATYWQTLIIHLFMDHPGGTWKTSSILKEALWGFSAKTIHADLSRRWHRSLFSFPVRAQTGMTWWLDVGRENARCAVTANRGKNKEALVRAHWPANAVRDSNCGIYCFIVAAYRSNRVMDRSICRRSSLVIQLDLAGNERGPIAVRCKDGNFRATNGRG